MPSLADIVKNQCGWIPPQERTREQQRSVEEWHEQIGWFEDRATFIPNAELPRKVSYYHAEMLVNNGRLLNRPYQYTGSCVGVSGARAQSHAMMGDKLVRGNQERVFLPFPFATYGIGRELSGARSTGSGSYGKVQAEAANRFGMVDVDFEKVPQPTIKKGWAFYSRDIELSWSHPRAWPVPRSEMEAHANEHQTLFYARIRTLEGLIQAMAQMFGLTIAGNFGSRPRIEKGYLIADWNDSWAHQMSESAYDMDTPLGLLFTEDNQWNRNPYGANCPTLGKILDKDGNNVEGSHHIRESVMERRIANSEVYAISDTEDFKPRKIDWGTWMGISV